MTTRHPAPPDPAPPAAGDRGMPPCRCPANCGGLPEARLKLVSPYPVITPSRARAEPPGDPYRPVRRGELVFDALNGRTGAFMGRMGRAVYLRPEGGGVEWETEPRWLAPPSVGPGG